MADYKKTVVNSQQDGVTEDGANVTSQTKQVHTEAAVSSKTMVANAIWFIVGLIEVVLGLRFIFKVLAANPASGFVSFLYSVSGFLSAPFDNIFGVSSAPASPVASVFEPSILVAMAVYVLIGWGIIKLISLNHPADVQ